MKWIGALFGYCVLAFALSGCLKKSEDPAPAPATTSSGTDTSSSSSSSSSPSATSFTLSGTATYEWVPAKDAVSEGGVRLDYAAEVTKPIRRAVVEAIDGSTIVASSTTLDNGAFSLSVTSANPVKVRVKAMAKTATSAADSIAPDNCVGASWDMEVVDNTNGKALWAMETSATYSTTTSGIALNAALTRSGSAYTVRTAAPFAILDTIVTAMETVCAGTANTAFPLLYINWSPSNTNVSGDKTTGNISTSHYTRESSVSNLYILGKEDVDTDEYDDHVIGHEFGHYLEDRIYRSDSIGGSHSLGDLLDPRVAFGEGYGNAFSGMIFGDAVYVDTSGSGQLGGFNINNASGPSGNDRGLHSERSAQFFLWSLFDNRDGSSGNGIGNYDRIHNILKNFQRTTPALTTLQSFAAYYNAQYGSSAESLQSLWTAGSGGLDLPYNSLCSGACSGSGDTADPFDADNDVGQRFATAGASPRAYGGSNFNANFWRLYLTLSSGVNADSDHDQTHLGGYSGSAAVNKFGMVRWYKYVGTGASTTITVGGSAPCGSDFLDLIVYQGGTRVAADESTSGCPSVAFTAASGVTYIVTIRGYSSAVASYNITVSP